MKRKMIGNKQVMKEVKQSERESNCELKRNTVR
jgi:hypothetical protein